MAFALTEGVKLERTPVWRLKVWVESEDGRRVRTLVPGTVYPRGRVGLTWHGLSDAGRRAPDGSYRPVVKLFLAHS